MRRGGAIVPDQPHFDDALLAVFGTLQRNARCYVEYGCGGSTMVAARLNLPTTSVEGDAVYAAAVRGRLPPNSSVRMVPVDIGLVGAWSIPTLRRPTRSRVRRWSAYPRAPFARGEIPRFDLALVDGRFRRACALELARQSALAASDCTIIIDDYVGRPSYAAVEAWLGEPELVGRAALFRIRGGALCRSVSEQDVLDATADWQ